MDLLERLGAYRAEEQSLTWDGTFAQYFDLVTKNPNIAQLSHARLYSMIVNKGTEETDAGQNRYKFFDGEIFGIDKSLEQIVEYFHSSAQRLEVRKRILLLMGPVGGGKSTIVTLLKRGLERYTRTDDGAVYAIRGCPMHEEPLHLVPESIRDELIREYGIYIEGDLCPWCRYQLEHPDQGGGHPWGDPGKPFSGRQEDVPVVRDRLLGEAPRRHRHLHARPIRSRRISRS